MAAFLKGIAEIDNALNTGHLWSTAGEEVEQECVNIWAQINLNNGEKAYNCNGGEHLTREIRADGSFILEVRADGIEKSDGTRLFEHLYALVECIGIDENPCDRRIHIKDIKIVEEDECKYV